MFSLKIREQTKRNIWGVGFPKKGMKMRAVLLQTLWSGWPPSVGQLGEMEMKRMKCNEVN
jgi:hypothetical protein